LRNQKPEKKPEARNQKPEGSPALRAELFFKKSHAREARSKLLICGFWFLASQKRNDGDKMGQTESHEQRARAAREPFLKTSARIADDASGFWLLVSGF
jgi:hypothetical protein